MKHITSVTKPAPALTGLLGIGGPLQKWINRGPGFPVLGNVKGDWLFRPGVTR